MAFNQFILQMYKNIFLTSATVLDIIHRICADLCWWQGLFKISIYPIIAAVRNFLYFI